MELLLNFTKELQKYIYKYIQCEAEGIKHSKETSVSDFNRQALEDFSYDEYHAEALENYPILSAVLTGAISNERFDEFHNPARKGFGGSRADELISLKPVFCQTISRLIHISKFLVKLLHSLML